MEVLFPLVRALYIDPVEIFYPETKRSSPMLQELRSLIEECSEEEAAALIPVLKSILTVLRSKEAAQIK